MTIAAPSERHPVEQLAEDFVTRYRRGERPSLSEYVKQYPDVSGELADIIHALLLLEDLGANGDATPNSPPLPERLGEYRILREIGRGGMGVVYEAEQGDLGRRVALKVLPAAALLRPTHLERFRREARAAARLHHTNIIPVFGVGSQDGIHYYAMQYIPGRGLDAILGELRKPTASPAADTAKAEGTPLTGSGRAGSADYYRAAARVGLQVAEALTHAHSHGVLHRDVKPANVIMDEAGTAWLGDFGLAHLEGDQPLTSTGGFVGTLRYLAPERFRGEGDARSDVYSAGATLYELLTQRPMFDETDRPRLIRQVTLEDPPAPRKVASAVPKDLETIVLKATAKNPADRYATASGFAEDLRRFLADRPVMARRVSHWESTRRWVRRNPVIAALLTAVLLTLSTGLVATWSQWRRAEKQHARAEDHRRKAFAAVDRMLTRVGEGELRHVPQMAEKRRQLLQDALGFYQQLLHEDATDPVARLEAGCAFVRVGDIYQWLGRLDQSDDAYRQGQALLEQLNTEFPGNARNRLALASVHRAMGSSAGNRGQYDSGKAHLLKSISLLEELDLEQPGNDEYQSALAASQHNLGNFYQEAGQLTNAQTAFLRTAAINDQLIRVHPGDKDHQQALATNLFSLATVYRENSRETEAETTFLKAIGAWDYLVRHHPDHDEYLAIFANVHQSLGVLYRRLGRLEKAEIVYDKALAIRQKLVHQHPQIPVFKLHLGNSHESMASLYRAMSRNKEAESAFVDALAVLEPLTRDHPDTLEYRSALGVTYNNLGMFLARMFDVAKAETAYGNALATHGELHRAHPENLQFAVNYAGSCVNFGDFLRNNGKLEPAVERYTQAIEAFEDARKREPHHEYSRSGLFGAYWGRAMAWIQGENVDKANMDWRRAVELSEGHANITMRTYRPMPLAYLGDHTRATREAETILAETKVEAGVLFDYACAYGLCSAAVWKDNELPTADREQLSERYALRAMEMLARSRATGRFKDPKRIQGLKSHSALSSLHPRADFQIFVAELEAMTSKREPN